MHDVLTIVMGGGKGTRLYPLTADRAKPAVPFGAKYRLVDIPLSNSIAANFKKIYVLTQFNTASLHLHIGNTYIFDSFTDGFVEILAAEQTFTHTGWYQGTADAVRKNLVHFRTQKPSHYLILSGDQLYRMDLRAFFEEHLASGAEASVAVLPVTREDATGFGILTVDTKKRIKKFTEKPPIEKDITSLRIPKKLAGSLENYEEGKDYLASMGIYIFNAEAMERVLDSDEDDFGKEIIPGMIKRTHVNAYFFNGFWEDIGTIESFYNVSLGLAEITPAFNLYDERLPIYTLRRDLAPTKLNSCTISQSLAADGSIITNSTVNRSVIGIRTIIDEGCHLDGVVCMGADYYEEPGQSVGAGSTGTGTSGTSSNDAGSAGGNSAGTGSVEIPRIGIGKNCLIRHAIIDKNARIGDNCRIGWDGVPPDGDYERVYVRDGVIVVPKNAIIPSGTIF